MYRPCRAETTWQGTQCLTYAHTYQLTAISRICTTSSFFSYSQHPLPPASPGLESILGAVARQRHCRWTSRLCPSCRAWLITPEPVAVQRFCARRATRKSFPISSHRALQAYTVWLRGEAQKVSPARRTECVSFDNSRVLCAWICLLLQSAQPRLTSANIECVILALP